MMAVTQFTDGGTVGPVVDGEGLWRCNMMRSFATLGLARRKFRLEIGLQIWLHISKWVTIWITSLSIWFWYMAAELALLPKGQQIMYGILAVIG